TNAQDTKQCQGLYMRGQGTLRGSTPDFLFLLGKSNLSDVNQGVIIEDFLVANGSASPQAGGCQFNFPTTDKIWMICDTQGGGGLNVHGIAAGAELVGASMNQLNLSATAGGCIFSGTCSTSLATVLQAANILVADPLMQVGLTTPPVTTSNTFGGGDIEL